MLPRTGARLGAALLASPAKRHVPQQCRRFMARPSASVENGAPLTAVHDRFCYSTLTGNNDAESATLARAIKQHNLTQARKSFELISRSSTGSVSRDTIRSLLLIARKSRKQSDLAFVQDIVGSMEARFGLAPQAFEYQALMYAYGVHGRPDKAHNVLEQMSQQGVKTDTFSYNTLLGCYKRAGNSRGALQLLDAMVQQEIARDVVTYNTVLHLLSDTEQATAFELYDRMRRQDGIQPDNYTFSTMLGIATKAGNTAAGDRVYADILASETAIDLYTFNNMLAYKANAAHDLQGALDLFRNPPPSATLQPDIVAYNLLLDACLKLGEPAHAFRLFGEMHANGRCSPDVVTYGALMDAEARLGNVEGALQRFDEMTQRSIAPNERVLASLANLASQEKDAAQLDRILAVVDRHSSQIELDAQAYNGLLSGLAKQGRSAQAQELYDRVFRYNTHKADIATYTNLMLAYINDALVDDAMDIYYELREYVHGADNGRFKLDATFYTTLISAMTRLPGNEMDFAARPAPSYAYTVDDHDAPIPGGLDGRSQDMLLTALALFNDMRRSMVRPTAHVYTAMLHACAKYKDAYVLEQVHKLIRMDLYFDPDTAVYNALMNAYSRVGDGHIVLQMWETLALSSAPETAIDQATVSIVLDSCGHNGYAHYAADIWHALKRIGFELNTNNYCSYVECLCRSSKGREGWEEARRVVAEEMRPLYSANSLVDPRPLVDDKTVNTLISFARKKAFPDDEIKALEAWKADLLRLPS